MMEKHVLKQFIKKNILQSESYSKRFIPTPYTYKEINTILLVRSSSYISEINPKILLIYINLLVIKKQR
jgi:hypothetical protein